MSVTTSALRLMTRLGDQAGSAAKLRAERERLERIAAEADAAGDRDLATEAMARAQEVDERLAPIDGMPRALVGGAVAGGAATLSEDTEAGILTPAKLAARHGEEAADRIGTALKGLRLKTGETPLSERAAIPTPQREMERINPPRGVPESGLQVVTPETARRLAAVAKKGIEKGGQDWYDTSEVLGAFQAELGDSGGREAFNRFMDYVAVTSPRSRVDSNIRRGSLFYQMDRAGLDPSVTTNADMPKGYGHIAHNIHATAAADLRDGGHFSSLSRPKTSSFAENLKMNLLPVTVDTHNVTSLTGVKRSPKANEYSYLEDFQASIAQRMGLDPAQFQSAVWTADDTGVANVANFTDLFNEAVERTAKRNKDTKRGVVEKFVRGEIPLYSLVAGTTLGALGGSNEADAAVVGPVLRSISLMRELGNAARSGRASLLGSEGASFPSIDREQTVRILDDLRSQHKAHGQKVFDRFDAGDGPGGAPGVARYELSPAYADALNAEGISTPGLVELGPDGSDAFHSAISDAKAGNRYGASVYVYEPDEYKGMRMFLTEDGTAGFALKPDGDVVSAFSDGTNPGVAPHLLLAAIEEGGTKLDAFDTVLPEIYSGMGFRETSRLPWDDSEAPPDWLKSTFSAFNGGEPDVSFMVQSPAPSVPVNPAGYSPDYGHALQRQGAALAGAMGAGGASASIDPEVEAEIDRRITTRLRGGQYAKRRRERQGRYSAIRESLLGAFDEITANIGAGLNPGEVINTLETPQRGLLGLAQGAVSMAQGDEVRSALRDAARVAQQPVEQTAYDVGGYVTDRTGMPALGAAANALTQFAAPL